MPANTDDRAKRRRGAVRSAVLSAVYQLLAAAVFFWICRTQSIPGWLRWLLAACIAADVLLLIPLGISLKQRLNEIQGGEEDEAAHY